MNTKPAEVVSGELVTPSVPEVKPYVMLAVDALALAPTVTIVVNAELRLLELTTGFVHTWTGSAWRVIGREADWIAKRAAQLEGQLAELHRSVGITDANALMRDALVAKLSAAEARVHELEEQVQAARDHAYEREHARDD